MSSSRQDGSEVILPEVVAIEMLEEVIAAAPVPIMVHTKNTKSARV